MRVFKHIASGYDPSELNGHEIVHLTYDSYIIQRKISRLDFLKHGISGGHFHARLTNPSYIQSLYLNQERWYMKYLDDLGEVFVDCDVIVINPGVDIVHPEFLKRHFNNKLRVLHFIDDPHLSYSYGFSQAWAYNAATYISPSYNVDSSMAEILRLVGFSRIKWLPHTVSNTGKAFNIDDFVASLALRNGKSIYVGGYYSGKAKRLIYLKKNLKNDFSIYGRQPLYGLMLQLHAFLVDKRTIIGRVRPLSPETLRQVYSRYSIGINMHLSQPNLETGNARLYELPFNGLTQVVDKSQYSGISEIFEIGEEILCYESIEECYEIVRMLIVDKKERERIALNGFVRAISDYSYAKTLNDELDWYAELMNSPA